MYQREFENLLRNNHPPRALLLYGDNRYLIDSYIQKYIDMTNSHESLRRYYFDEYDFEQSKRYLGQNSLFGGVNLLILKRDKKIPKRELDILIALVNKNPNNYLLLEYVGTTRDATYLQKSFSPKNGANWVRLFQLNVRENITILQNNAHRMRLHIEYDALKYLITLFNNNLEFAINELRKLAILDKKITVKDIDELVYSTTPFAIEELFVSMFNKEPIINNVRQLIEFGIDEFNLLRSAQLFINQILLFKIFIRLNGYIDSKLILGYRLPKIIEQQRAGIARKIKNSDLLKISKHLIELEIRLKNSTATEREPLLYGGFIKLQDYL